MMPKDVALTLWRGQVETRVKVAGKGPPLVYFHGASGPKWDGWLSRLADRYTVYAPEHPGTSAGLPNAIHAIDSLWELVLFYDELFDALGLERPFVMGHSFGGMVAAEIAATRPDRVGKLVLVSPVGLWRDDAPLLNWMIVSPEQVFQASFHDPRGEKARQFSAFPADPEQMKEAIVQATWSLACTGKFTWPIPDKGLKRRMHRIKAPTLIVWGQSDRIVPVVYAEEFRQRIAQAQVRLFERSGHLPHIEEEEGVTAAIEEFLR
ncbi:alpha/beta hydrolase [Archangium violaceum]|uniref:alpha/beta fold hydrolase n=1 Tax=Archangium violaceum TaxID=83451 RepID=UPI00193B12BC|nr:alpha/beta hydrolase [Archangium violaceum]QRK09725.1 alpha/beta hydrolase [Archangium violaceum]